MAAIMAATTVAMGSAASAADMMKKGDMANNNMVTVEEAMGMNDEAMVVLKGNLKKGMGEEMYVFTDSTGSINVEIDQEYWNKSKVQAEDMVIITGEVDKSGNVVEIDVDEIMMTN